MKIFSSLRSSVFVLAFFLTGIGLLNLYSATLSFQDVSASSYFRSQVFYHSFGILLMLFFSHWREVDLERFAVIAYVLSLVLLILVLVFGVRIHGSQSWLDFGFFRLQPSEFAKLGLILMLSRYFANLSERTILELGDLFMPLLICLFPMGLVILQKDLGTSLFFSLIFMTMVSLQGIRFPLVAVGLIILILTSVVAYHQVLAPYQQKRIVSFLDPEIDSKGSGYHLVQSKITVGSGKLFGKGYRQGQAHKLKFLPERHTDFIFPVLAEEWGFAGSAITVILYLFFFLSGVQIANRTLTRFGFFLVVGMVSLFFWHVFINLGGVLGLIPLTGVPLPFLSYGGSAVLAAWMAVGFVLAIREDRGMFPRTSL